MSTVFSRIIAGELPGRFVWSDEQCVAIASIAPITAGHMLVIPRIEVAKFTETDDVLLSQLMKVAKAVGQACEVAFDAPRAALIIAGFEIDHLHLHVFPAWGDTELSFAKAHPATADELDAACERVRTALIELGYSAKVPTDMYHR
ncbi:MAG: HIT family protein [Propionibacteriaceae bacterium]|jgi:diadenosine tetraphosphate (Ap4A) HIT family hydrolase|nr:HIT family protein [Propionibacteriaceae bacterium]